MQNFNEEDLWDKYQTDLRYIYEVKKREKPIYPLYHYVLDYVSNIEGYSSLLIAEIGFGDGSLLESLSKKFNKVVGLDISKKNLIYTQDKFKLKRISNAEFRHYDIRKGANFNEKFDILVLSHVLEHFSDSEFGVITKNLRDLLKDEGVIICATPYQKKLQDRICPNCSHVFEIDGHKQVLDELKIKELLESNDFKLLSVRNFNPTHYYWGWNKAKALIHNFLRKFFRMNIYTQLEFVAKKK